MSTHTVQLKELLGSLLKDSCVSKNIFLLNSSLPLVCVLEECFSWQDLPIPVD